jgi:hypothetical protein
MASRPYRLLNGKHSLVGCCYVDPTNALNGALKRTQWQDVGTTIEVVNVESGRLIGTYTRHARGEITFWRNVNG